jgi:hypothetical protein
VSSALPRQEHEKIIVYGRTAGRRVFADNRDIVEADLKSRVAGFIRKHAVIDNEFTVGDLFLPVCHFLPTNLGARSLKLSRESRYSAESDSAESRTG